MEFNPLVIMKVLIIATGYNCEGYAEKCIASVQAQTYQNYEAVFISDGSTDKTGGMIVQYCDKVKDERLIPKLYSINNGAAKRRYDAIKEYAKDKETVILLLGLDDELMPNCLERIKKEYDNGKWMTYGNWKNQHGKMLPKGFLNFPDIIHNDRSYRKVQYRSTAPNTFKRFLFDQIPEDDFKINGEWIKSTTESELMFSCLEMCGKHMIGVIEDPIYLYNENLPGGTLKRLGVKYKYDIYNQVIQRPKKPLYTK